jgi:glycosyltransferase involved in cell wall biosynthesis
MALRLVRPPRVAYLSFFFPPSRASGVFRARATANHLAEAGWDVTVFTAPREFFVRHLAGAVDDSLEGTVDPRVRVRRAPVRAYGWETDVRRFGVLRRNFPTVCDQAYARLQRTVFPEHYLGWAPGLLAAVLRAHVRAGFDVVLATGNPFVSFPVAWLLGRLLRRPYIVDYRDAWTFNQFTERVRFPEGGRVMGWEARVLRHAAEAAFVNDGMRRWHADRYPFAADRMTVVPNGWDPEVFARAEFRPPPPDRPLRFGYLGTVTSYLPLDVLFAGWRSARAEHPALAGAELNIHGHLGFFPADAAALGERIAAEHASGVRYRGPFGKTEATAVYGDTDALVLCIPGGRYVTSGKVFEYMASGKPIVSVHEPELAATDVLDGYPLWSACERLDADSVARSFVAAAEAARGASRAGYDAAVRHAQRYARTAALAPLERRMRELAGRPA